MPKPQLRAEQGWIFDNFLMLSDSEDVLHPGIMGNRLERGTKYEDLQAVYSRVSGRRSFPKAWGKRAEVLERMARDAETLGRLITAQVVDQTVRGRGQLVQDRLAVRMFQIQGK